MIEKIWFVVVVMAVKIGLSPCCSQPNSPIVIVPGILGNQIEGKLNKTSSPHYLCTKQTSDYVTLWLAVTELFPERVDCLSDNLRLVYDPSTGAYNNSPGVKIRVPGFGNTSSVEFLDPDTSWFMVTQYFHAMVDHFVKKGYERGKNIVGAPYDWRVSPNQYVTKGYYERLKELIETTYYKNNKQQVVLVAHSMGSPTALYFLTKIVDSNWKDTYIRDFITMSGVWHGTAKSSKAFVSGDNEGIWIIPNDQGRSSQRTYPSTAWLLPYPSETWSKKDVLIVTPKRNYTAWDYKELFDDIDYKRGYDMFEEISGLTSALPPPNVTMHCLYGTNVKTPLQFVYSNSEFPDEQPKTIFGDGDGTVNIKSLMACGRWKGEQSHSVTLKSYYGVEHVQMIKEPSVISYVDAVVYKSPQ